MKSLSEILAILIRKNDDIKGITVNNTQKKIGQFADDLNLFSVYEGKSLNGIIEALTTFEYNTGLQVNYDKTNIYRIGSLKNSDAKLYTAKEFNWTNADIDILGIKISTDPKTLIDINYTAVCAAK